MTTFCPISALQRTQDKGCIQVAPGVYLQTQAHILQDPPTLPANHGIDFTTAPFWLTTATGEPPHPVFDSLDDDLLDLWCLVAAAAA